MDDKKIFLPADIQLSTSSDANAPLQLSPIIINDDYRSKWNIHLNDFVCLTKNGKLISNSLYRVGGIGGYVKDDYFMLLKHVEAFYPDDITTDPKRKPHLEDRWCILDKNGIKKVECTRRLDYPRIFKGSCIYAIRDKYFNIESGEFYCSSSSCMISSEYLFLENKYSDDESKRGVMKIDKKTGTWELYK